jgi:Tol biopolymer transport system component
MRRIGTFFVLAFALSPLACSDATTNPVDLIDPPPAVDDPPPAVEPPAPDVPATAAIAFVSTRDGAAHIYVASADGSEVTRVTEGLEPGWSWDGRKIAFARRASGPGPAGIYVLDLDGPTLRHVGPGGQPAWSPDGRIAFRSSFSRIYAMNADGSGVTQLIDAVEVLTDWGAPGNWLPNYQLGGGPTWSPDGRSLLFRALVPGWGRRVAIAELDGANPRELEELRDLPILGNLPAGWSPDGFTIAVITHPGPWEVCDAWLGCRPGPGFGKSSVIYRYDAGSDLGLGEPEVIYTAPAFLASDSDWSPDGRHVVFAANFSPQDGSGRRRIFTVSLETGEVRQLIPEAASPAFADYEDHSAVWFRGNR